jgi:protein-S-isoprenylcysteine O-methyltransferase Ste14
MVQAEGAEAPNKESGSSQTRANHSGGVLALTVLLILMTIAFIFGLAYFLSSLLKPYGFNLSAGLPIGLRLLGLVLVTAGAIVEFFTMRHRRPMDVLVSTSDTFVKLFKRRPAWERPRRTEPFIIAGSYVFTRNPMYLGVVMFIFGFGLAFSSTALILWGAIATLWFYLVQIPFEERELMALFGDTYAQYKRQVPALFPNRKKFKKSES